MLFNSRSISFIMATLIAVFTAGVSYMLLTKEVLAVFVILTASFIGAFFICFLALETFIFKEIRKLLMVLNRLRASDLTIEKSHIDSYKNIGQEFIAFINTKQREVDNLKRLENFRREFLADISHELKTPVFAAQGFVHTLLDGAMDDEAVRDKFLKKAANSLDALDNLVNDLVIISQVESGEVKMDLATFDLLPLVKNIFEMLEEKARSRGVSLKLLTRETKVFVYADQYRISQVIKNLVDNAIKYGSDNGGNITVSIKSVKEQVKIEVEDQGKGIPKDHQPQIFKRFYRVDKSRSKEKGGTGLGLAIVKHIVEAHASKIFVSSEAEKGTTFTFKLTRGLENEI